MSTYDSDRKEKLKECLLSDETKLESVMNEIPNTSKSSRYGLTVGCHGSCTGTCAGPIFKEDLKKFDEQNVADDADEEMRAKVTKLLDCVLIALVLILLLPFIVSIVF